MKIGIFTKMDLCGGSEARAIELCNAIVTYTDHESYLFTEKDIPDRLEKALDPRVKLYKNLFLPSPNNIEKLYDLDVLLVISTDSKSYTLSDFWEGRSEKHGTKVDLHKIKKMVFLFNFLVSPARHLYTIERYVRDIKIITANTKFFEEISKQDRYELVRHFPRMILESPINPDLYDSQKTESEILRFGFHSKNPDNKWNDDIPKLIEKCRIRLGQRVNFDFMGMNSKRAREVRAIDRKTTLRQENEISVREYLHGIDIFMFFPSYSRSEPWSRCLGEAMMSGCPIITTDKGGNKDQVVHGNNGFLCKSTNDFFKHIVYLTENREKIVQMSKNSLLLARHFTSENVIKRFIDFVEN